MFSYVALVSKVKKRIVCIGLSLTHTECWRQIRGWKCLKDVSLPPTNPLERAGLSVCDRPDRVFEIICL